MPLSKLTLDVLNACFSDKEFKKSLKNELSIACSEDASERISLSILKIVYEDPDLLDAAIN